MHISQMVSLPVQLSHSMYESVFLRLSFYLALIHKVSLLIMAPKTIRDIHWVCPKGGTWLKIQHNPGHHWVRG
jgi:hypothetical protein